METKLYNRTICLTWILILLYSIVKCDEPDRVIYIRDVRVQVYESTGNNQTLKPATIFLHGGGWRGGSPHFTKKRDFIAAILERSMIFAVDYSLKLGFPTLFNENLRVTKELLKNGRFYNVDSNNVYIMGESSGGNMAAAVAYELNKSYFTPKLKAQFLFYAPLQAIDFNTTSYSRDGDEGHLKRKLMVYLWAAYWRPQLTTTPTEMIQNQHQTEEILQRFRRSVGVYDINESNKKESLSDELTRATYWHRIYEPFMNPMFAPLMAESMAGLPPTVLYASRNEILLDDSIFYHRRLQEDGVEVDFVIDEYGHHGSIWSRATESGVIYHLIKHYEHIDQI